MTASPAAQQASTQAAGGAVGQQQEPRPGVGGLASKLRNSAPSSVGNSGSKSVALSGGGSDASGPSGRSSGTGGAGAVRGCGASAASGGGGSASAPMSIPGSGNEDRGGGGTGCSGGSGGGGRSLPGSSSLGSAPAVMQSLNGEAPVWWKRAASAFGGKAAEGGAGSDRAKRGVKFHDQVSTIVTATK